MRNLPISIQDFQKLREGNFIYVDKTSLIYELAKNSTPYSADKRKIYKIGVNFSSELCNIDGWEVQ